MKSNFLFPTLMSCVIFCLISCGGSEGNFKQNLTDSSYADSVSRAKMSELPAIIRSKQTADAKEGVFHGVPLRGKYTF